MKRKPGTKKEGGWEERKKGGEKMRNKIIPKEIEDIGVRIVAPFDEVREAVENEIEKILIKERLIKRTDRVFVSPWKFDWDILEETKPGSGIYEIDVWGDFTASRKGYLVFFGDFVASGFYYKDKDRVRLELMTLSDLREEEEEIKFEEEEE